MTKPFAPAPTLMVDVDGVVVHSDGPWYRLLLADLGVAPTQLQQVFFDQHWSSIIVGRTPIERCLAEALAQIAPRVGVEQLLHYWFHRAARLNQELLSELAQLRRTGVNCHCATNQEHRRADFLWRHLGLSRHFDAIHYSASLGARKPDPAFYDCVVKQTGLRPRDIVLLDDTPANIEAAHHAGWSGVLWAPTGSLHDLLADQHFLPTRPS